MSKKLMTFSVKNQNMVGLERGTVKLEKHRQSWRQKYKEEVSRLQSILGEKAYGFEHIGSTAIDGIKAKPVIDMIAVVDLEKADSIVSTLEENGYEHRPNGDLEDRIFLAKGPEKNRTHYLSLTEKGSEFYKRTTAFRDYLNAHPGTAEKYSQLKEELAEKYPNNRDRYTEEKGEFIEKIVEKAKNKKQATERL